MKKKIAFIIVNSLTAIRLLGSVFLIPVYFWYGGLTAAFLTAICYITDLLDGILARRLKCATFFGSIFDGFSDKVFNIVNLLVFLTITPVSIIAIFLEVMIMLIQLYKYKNNMVVKTSMIGKFKMWVAGFTMFIALILSSKIKASYLSLLLIPLIISEAITVLDYIKGIVAFKNKKIKVIKRKKEKFSMTLNEMLFNPKFYEENKDDINIKTVCQILTKK